VAAAYLESMQQLAKTRPSLRLWREWKLPLAEREVTVKVNMRFSINYEEVGRIILKNS